MITGLEACSVTPQTQHKFVSAGNHPCPTHASNQHNCDLDVKSSLLCLPSGMGNDTAAGMALPMAVSDDDDGRAKNMSCPQTSNTQPKRNPKDWSSIIFYLVHSEVK